MTTEKRYFAEIYQSSDGKVRFGLTKQLIDVNQHKRAWKRVNSRQIARAVNRGKIVIK